VSESKSHGSIVLLVSAVFIGSTTGCEGPNMVPTAPPGIEYHEFLPQKKQADEDLPQAQGETRGAVKAATATIVPDLVPAPPTALGETKTTKSGVKYETLKEGTDPVAKAGDHLKLHYTGTLEDGKIFETTSKDKTPKSITIGVGVMIKGWDEGVPGMKVGERRKLWIPANAGYGALGKPGVIPVNAPLIFEIELVGIEP
jgi:FKBP-type peptidyl-prolyl cis-trans isomerase